MNIFVAKLNFRTSEDALREAFEQFGEVDSVKIIMDRDTGRSKGYGFVEMSSEDEGDKAIEGLNETDLDGSRIVCKKARPKEDRPRDSRGGGNFRSGGGGGYNQRY